MNTESNNKSTEAKHVLPAVFVKTRYEAEEAMKQGNNFKSTCYVTPYNRNMLDSYMLKYNYKKTKVEKGIDLYQPDN